MKTLVEKMFIKPGYKVLLLNEPEGYNDLLGDLPEDVELVEESDKDIDVVQLFVHNAADLKQHLPPAMQAIKHEGLLWISYLKGGKKAGTDLNRDILAKSVQESYGWRGVSLISIDKRWSSMRFRPGELVGS